MLLFCSVYPPAAEKDSPIKPIRMIAVRARRGTASARAHDGASRLESLAWCDGHPRRGRRDRRRIPPLEPDGYTFIIVRYYAARPLPAAAVRPINDTGRVDIGTTGLLSR